MGLGGIKVSPSPSAGGVTNRGAGMSKHHLCCGQRKRARVVDGLLIEQPHKCQDVDREPDWVAFQAEQVEQAEAGS